MKQVDTKERISVEKNTIIWKWGKTWWQFNIQENCIPGNESSKYEYSRKWKNKGNDYIIHVGISTSK